MDKTKHLFVSVWRRITLSRGIFRASLGNDPCKLLLLLCNLLFHKNEMNFMLGSIAHSACHLSTWKSFFMVHLDGRLLMPVKFQLAVFEIG